MVTGLPTCSMSDGPTEAGRALEASATSAIQLPRPAKDDLPYRGLVDALLGCPGFKLDFRGQSPEAVLAMVAERLIGPGALPRERAAFAGDIAVLSDFMRDLVGGCRPQVAIRTYFAPGDLVWHVDRVSERVAYRLVWPIGRPAGMSVTTLENVDARLFDAFMRREHPLLCALDARVTRTGADVERIWAHRPKQLEAMRSGTFPFIRDPQEIWQVKHGFASIHRVETPAHPGTFHRSSWSNRASPGLQVVITVVAD